MNGVIDKLSSRRGETLAETLISMAVIVLAAALAAVMLTAAYRINLLAKSADEAYNSELSAAECQTGEPLGREKAVIKIKSSVSDAERVEAEIYVYGSDSLRSYSSAGAGG